MSNNLRDEERFVQEIEIANSVTPKRHVMSITEALEHSKNLPELEMLWMGIPNTASLNFMMAPSKVGKTILMENFGYAIASDADEFMGYKIPKGKIVAFVSLEEFYNTRMRRTRKQMADIKSLEYDADKIGSRFFVVNPDFPRHLGEKDTIKFISEIVSETKADILIIDSLSRMYSGKIEESELAKKVIQRLKDLADSLAIPLIIIHHSTKGGGKELNQNSMAGSRILSQECDSLIGVNKAPNGIRYIKPISYRYADDNIEEYPSFTIENSCLTSFRGITSMEDIVKSTDGRYGSKNFDLIYYMIRAEKSIDASSLSKKFVKAEIMSKSTLYDVLQKMQDSGKIVKSNEGNYSVPS